MKAHLIRGAFYLLLLLALCAIAFALGQPTTGDRSTPANIAQPRATSIGSGAAALVMQNFQLKSPVAHPNHEKAH